MQGKGAIRFFAIALAIACVYSLSFTFVSSGVEKDAIEFANGDPLKEKAYLNTGNCLIVYQWEPAWMGLESMLNTYAKVPNGIKLKRTDLRC